MIQQNLFDTFILTNPVNSKAGHVWVVEQLFRNKWEPVGIFMCEDRFGEPYFELGVGAKREYARDVARRIRERGREVRVVPYVSRYDSKGRVNRQVRGERKS